MTNAVLTLAPQSTINGRVLDEKDQPKAGFTVEAFRISAAVAPAQLASIAKATTNESGVYSIHGLISGNYYVATSLPHEDKTDSNQPYILYSPSATGLDQAASAHLDTGQTLSDVDIHLRPITYFKLQGRAQMDTMGASSDLPKLRLSARDTSGVLLRARDIHSPPMAVSNRSPTRLLYASSHRHRSRPPKSRCSSPRQARHRSQRQRSPESRPHHSRAHHCHRPRSARRRWPANQCRQRPHQHSPHRTGCTRYFPSRRHSTRWHIYFHYLRSQ